MYHKYINYIKLFSQNESELSSWSVSVGMLLTACQSASSPEENPEAEFIDAIKDSGANLVGASALLTTTMLQQKKLIEGLEDAGLRDRVKMMVGGAPVTENFCKRIGADGYAEDAISAIDIAFRLIDAPV